MGSWYSPAQTFAMAPHCLADDFQVIRNMLIQKQNAETIDQWIRNKQKEVYIHIDPAWRGCDFQYPNWVHQ